MDMALNVASTHTLRAGEVALGSVGGAWLRERGGGAYRRGKGL